MNLEGMLIEGAGKFGAGLGNEQVRKLMKYGDMLKEWNKKINLTAIEDDREIIIKHFIDSLSVLPYIKNENISFVDIGTGAGFPGIPIKIVFDRVNVTLLDSLDKRVKFLDEVINVLGLEGISAVHGRAEDYGSSDKFRERFDVAAARAVANLPVLLEYCLPFIRTGGLFVAMKGSSTDEVGVSAKALDILGGSIEKIEEVTLPFSDIKRNLILVRKLRHTPTKYPRKAGKPSKDPLVQAT